MKEFVQSVFVVTIELKLCLSYASSDILPTKYDVLEKVNPENNPLSMLMQNLSLCRIFNTGYKNHTGTNYNPSSQFISLF